MIIGRLKIIGVFHDQNEEENKIENVFLVLGIN